MAYPFMHGFPVNASGIVVLIASSAAFAPYSYANGLKFDVTGALVVAG